MRRLAVLLALAPALACDPAVQDAPQEEPAPVLTTFDGVFAGGEGTESGRVVLEIDAAVDPTAPSGSGDVSARAILYGLDGLMRLSGSYDQGSTELILDGADHAVNAHGSAAGLEGTYSGPAGPGVLVLQLRSPALQVYCGTFDGISTGFWNLLVSAQGVSTGVVGPVHGDPDISHGVVQGSDYSSSGSAGTSHGTVENGTMSGTWALGGVSGEFHGSTDACPVVP